jgi:molybdopterin synthase sulfur carrier subunit
VLKLLKVSYFAWLRERTGAAEEEFALPDGIETVGQLIDYLTAKDAGHAAAFRNRKIVRCAVNQEFGSDASPIRPGDEVAFFPPVTGG